MVAALVARRALVPELIAPVSVPNLVPRYLAHPEQRSLAHPAPRFLVPRVPRLVVHPEPRRKRFQVPSQQRVPRLIVLLPLLRKQLINALQTKVHQRKL